MYILRDVRDGHFEWPVPELHRPSVAAADAPGPSSDPVSGFI
jgi:hypothetical protein